MAKKPKKDELIRVAKELNATIKPDPLIDTEKPIKDLFHQIKIAASLLEPGDKISEEMAAFFDAQKIEYRAEKAEPRGEPDIGIGGDKTTKKAKPKPKTEAKPAMKMTRFNAVAQVLKAANEPLTKAQIAKRGDALYAKNGGTSNDKEANWATGMVLSVLGQFDMLTEDDGKFQLLQEKR